MHSGSAQPDTCYTARTGDCYTARDDLDDLENSEKDAASESSASDDDNDEVLDRNHFKTRSKQVCQTARKQMAWHRRPSGHCLSETKDSKRAETEERSSSSESDSEDEDICLPAIITNRSQPTCVPKLELGTVGATTKGQDKGLSLLLQLTHRKYQRATSSPRSVQQRSVKRGPSLAALPCTEEESTSSDEEPVRPLSHTALTARISQQVVQKSVEGLKVAAPEALQPLTARGRGLATGALTARPVARPKLNNSDFKSGYKLPQQGKCADGCNAELDSLLADLTF